MKVNATIFKEGGIDCHEKNCPFRQECANHETAGQFRSEDGFTPEIAVENDVVYCGTRNKKIKENWHIAVTVPENYDKLTRGALYLDKEKNLKIYSIYDTND